jgi:hypothetical protein
MAIELKDCKLITIEEYCELESPKFMGQTTVNTDGVYWMAWECDGILYKTKNNINIEYEPEPVLNGDMANEFNSNNEDYYPEDYNGI